MDSTILATREAHRLHWKWKWKLLSCVRLFATRGLQVHRILQARILEWVALSLLQGIFPTQGLNPGLPHYRWILYQLSHKGSPRILEWVAYPFSSRSSRPRALTNKCRVFCTAGRFFTNWATREAHRLHYQSLIDMSDWKIQSKIEKSRYLTWKQNKYS